jgi:hypothetical protein
MIALKCPHPAGNSPVVNVRREMGKFKPVIFGQIHAAGDIARRYASQAQSRRRRWPERPGFTGAALSETIGSPVQLRLDPPLCARPP